MGNVLVAIGHDIKVVAKDTVHGIEDAFTIGAKLIKIIESGESLTPEFKEELETLVTDLKPVAAALAPVIAGAGENTAADLAAIAPVLAGLKKAVHDFLTFLPTLEAAYETIKQDVAASPEPVAN